MVVDEAEDFRLDDAALRGAALFVVAAFREDEAFFVEEALRVAADFVEDAALREETDFFEDFFFPAPEAGAARRLAGFFALADFFVPADFFVLEDFFVLADFFVLDASASATWRRYALTVRGANLGDTKKYGSGAMSSGEARYFVLPGRAMFATLSVQF